MAFRSWPHDYEPDLTTPQEVTESEFRFNLAAATQTGVDSQYGSVLSASIQGDTVVIGTGRGIISGYAFLNDSPTGVAVPANTSSLPRLYWVVARLDVAASTVAPTVVEGTPSSSPQLPALVQTDAVYDLPLWSCRRDGAGGPITQLTDHRVYLNPGGAVACTSTARPYNPLPGTVAYETDTGRLIYWHAGQWLTAADASYPSAWQALPLRSGYGPHGIGHAPSWRWDAPGVVRLRGTIARTDGEALPMGDYIGVLPAAIRPSAYVNVALGAHATRGGNSVRLQITSTNDPGAGRMTLWYSPASYAPHWVSLDGVTYTP